jgi:hypothetical protein
MKLGSGGVHPGLRARRRIRRIFLALLLATAIGLVHMATAAAATAVVEPRDTFFGIDTLRYLADTGEANSVTITPVTTASALEITDTGG